MGYEVCLTHSSGTDAVSLTSTAHWIELAERSRFAPNLAAPTQNRRLGGRC